MKTLNEKLNLLKKKIDGGYNLIIDSNIISVSKIVNYLSKYHINDLDIDNEQIDDIILKLYQDYKIWKLI